MVKDGNRQSLLSRIWESEGEASSGNMEQWRRLKCCQKCQEKDTSFLAMPPIGQTYMEARGKRRLGNVVLPEAAKQQKDKGSESKEYKWHITVILTYITTYLARSKQLIYMTFLGYINLL